ncbi:hypothetical protein LZQ00_08585 [Sphingobacterium sp. SRCM116780]|uniref:hypothetical protein n=1 Tax=Sphingobacterium sp. SRCM116780 TaxID=2907623 RepID=UPI001F46EEA0|nr:hypothetical protein [Sphingobacterium sp. SRCM116780]UIR57862.1 hypothetical protein LZQ00_08585 [Sphingobacterium sp. SRCM116780]
MKKKTILIVFISILLVPNLPIINKYIAHRLDEGHFRYANLDGSFIITQNFSFKSPGFSTFSFEHFIKETSPAKENQKLYRLYKINPLCFWRWKNYIVNGVHFDYMDWEVIDKNMQKKR